MTPDFASVLWLAAGTFALGYGAGRSGRPTRAGYQPTAIGAVRSDPPRCGASVQPPRVVIEGAPWIVVRPAGPPP